LETLGSLLLFAGFVGFTVGAISLVRPIAWTRIRNRKQSGIVGGLSFVVFLIGGAFLPAEETDTALESATTTTTAVAVAEKAESSDTTQARPASSTTTTAAASSATSQAEETATSVAVSVPQYDIIDEEDVSFAGAVRYSLRVTVEEGTTREGLRRVAAKISEQYRTSRKYSALNILFYHYPEVSDDIASLGVWDDSPYGDWGRAGEVKPGDYSTHEPNDQTKEKDWSLLPSQRDATLYAAYNTLFYSLAETSDELPSDDDVIAAVAEQEAVSVAAVEEAIDRFLDWMFNDES